MPSSYVTAEGWSEAWNEEIKRRCGYVDIVEMVK